MKLLIHNLSAISSLSSLLRMSAKTSVSLEVKAYFEANSVWRYGMLVLELLELLGGRFFYVVLIKSIS